MLLIQLYHQSTQAQVGHAAGLAQLRVSRDGDLVGASSAFRDVQKAIGLLADSDATVLLLGETGTGKEVVARAIDRHGKPPGLPSCRSIARRFPPT